MNYGYIKKNTGKEWRLCYLREPVTSKTVTQLPNKDEVIRQMGEMKLLYPQEKYRLLVIGE